MAFSAAPRGPQTARFSLAGCRGRSGRGPKLKKISSRDLDCSELLELVCTDRVKPFVRSVATLSRSAEGAVPRLTGFNPVRLSLRRDSALLFREGLRNLVSCLSLFLGTVCEWRKVPQRLPIPSQFTKRRIRTFITIPSAKNMKSTDDPP